jgi:hypothetical protein
MDKLKKEEEDWQQYNRINPHYLKSYSNEFIKILKKISQ